MRIKKVSQVAGLVGGVSNTYSESTNDAYSCDYVNDLNTYSTTEQVIGTWKNNKPIYRLIITGLTLSPKPSGTAYSNNLLTNIENLIDVKMTRDSGPAVAVCSANHTLNTNSITIYAITEFSNCDTLILEYTKTTD